MVKKMTYVQALVNAIEVVEDVETRARLEDLKTSLEKKASSKKKTVDNSGYYNAIRNALADGAMTPTDLAAIVGVANTQKVAAIVKTMGDEIVKDTKGKKITYRLA